MKTAKKRVTSVKKPTSAGGRETEVKIFLDLFSSDKVWSTPSMYKKNPTIVLDSGFLIFHDLRIFFAYLYQG